MLSVLAFKRSLAAGILDGGNTDIALDGTRLSRFMKEVEAVTGAVAPGEPIAPAEEMLAVEAEPDEEADDPGPQEQAPDHAAGHVIAGVAAPRDGKAAAAAAAPAAASRADPWAALLGAGAQLVEALAAASRPAGDGASHPWVERDEKSGQTHLRLPLPEPETVGRIAEVLAGLAAALGKRR